MPILSFWGSVWFGEKPKTKKNQKNQCQFIISQKPKTKKTQKNQKIPKKNQKKPKNPKKTNAKFEI
jgi:C1A family cysteine protease